MFKILNKDKCRLVCSNKYTTKIPVKFSHTRTKLFTFSASLSYDLLEKLVGMELVYIPKPGRVGCREFPDLSIVFIIINKWNIVFILNLFIWRMGQQL